MTTGQRLLAGVAFIVAVAVLATFITKTATGPTRDSDETVKAQMDAYCASGGKSPACDRRDERARQGGKW